eukprot:TRINITY_DN80898_c0_g1_i1.p1 TRINITY_DN80898_c0_g1~~TRINITY_DN80898_c0_g1_i1.p1  ORF type:complete len:1042 (-),score=161.27 TRINITY_DN80898_c0_g1_i1:64-3189(-)
MRQAFGETASTSHRCLEAPCVTNFYPIRFAAAAGGPSSSTLSIRVFNVRYFDLDNSAEQIKQREDSQLKRRIFEAATGPTARGSVEEAFGVRALQFGGDCAAGLCAEGDAAMRAVAAASVEDSGVALALGVVDRYEANQGGDWLPAVVRELDGEEAAVELYAPGSFWSEGLARVGPVYVGTSEIRPRRWEVCRGEVLRVPDGDTLRIGAGQQLLLRARGPTAEEPAGRLALGVGSQVVCEAGGHVENEGTVECMVEVEDGDADARRYSLEVESMKTLLVESLGGIVDSPFEERSVVLQCFSWVFECAYRQMKLKTLGGRGWYCAEEGQTFPLQVSDDRQLPPRLRAYKGFAASLVQLPKGPHLKVDLSLRLLQGDTAWAKINFFKDAFLQQRERCGLPPPTPEEIDEFIQSQMKDRTCVATHNNMHYKIARVCLDMDPSCTFPTETGDISYLDYYHARHGIKLTPVQPLLHCPFRAKPGLYLPAEIACLTGLDDQLRQHRQLLKGLWRDMRQDPTSHWKEQTRLVQGVAAARRVSDGAADGEACLAGWGLQLDQEPLTVTGKRLEGDVVYASLRAHDYFRAGRSPPSSLCLETTSTGFTRRPWPEVWSTPGQGLDLSNWVVVSGDRADEQAAVESFLHDLELLVDDVLSADSATGRIEVGSPEVIAIPSAAPENWVQYINEYQTPWPPHETKLVVVVVPDKVRRREKIYSLIKDQLFFRRSPSLVSQVIMSSTLRCQQSRMKIWQNILQQMLAKRGAWFWITSPLPYMGRIVMAIGIDTRRCGQDGAIIQTLCATTNPYFTSIFSTWRCSVVPTCERDRRPAEHRLAPGELVKDAVLHFHQQNGRLPDTLIVYRAGVSESQETEVVEHDLYDPDQGILGTLVAISEDTLKQEEDKNAWRTKFELAYIVVRRRTNARFRTESGENLPTGTYIDEHVVVHREHPEEKHPQLFDFYMVPQSNVTGTARPSLYSVLYSTLTFSKEEVIRFTYRLCTVYQLFPGVVSTPAPLKYASKLLTFLSKCPGAAPEPTSRHEGQQQHLFFV